MLLFIYNFMLLILHIVKVKIIVDSPYQELGILNVDRTGI